MVIRSPIDNEENLEYINKYFPIPSEDEEIACNEKVIEWIQDEMNEIRDCMLWILSSLLSHRATKDPHLRGHHTLPTSISRIHQFNLGLAEGLLLQMDFIKRVRKGFYQANIEELVIFFKLNEKRDEEFSSEHKEK